MLYLIDYNILVNEGLNPACSLFFFFFFFPQFFDQEGDQKHKINFAWPKSSKHLSTSKGDMMWPEQWMTRVKQN